MSKHNKFKHESQDARRHDQQHAIHPDTRKPSSKNKKSKLESRTYKKSNLGPKGTI